MRRITYEKGYKFPDTRLTVVKNLPTKYGKAQVECLCDCGNVWIGYTEQMKSGSTKSCGCFNSEKAAIRSKVHGLSKHPLYQVYNSMKQRCYNKNKKAYKNYGGRGIIICEEWLCKESGFMNFYTWAVANGWKRGLHIDREDNDGNYCPENCRLTTPRKNSRNTRKNRKITINGETRLLVEWAELTGISIKTITSRIRMGWNESDLIKKVG